MLVQEATGRGIEVGLETSQFKLIVVDVLSRQICLISEVKYICLLVFKEAIQAGNGALPACVCINVYIKYVF